MDEEKNINNAAVLGLYVSSTFFYCHLNVFFYTYGLTSIEHPMSDSRSTDLSITVKRCAGGFSIKSNDSVMPPVKSSIASQLEPPFRFSYEPYSLQSTVANDQCRDGTGSRVIGS